MLRVAVVVELRMIQRKPIVVVVVVVVSFAEPHSTKPYFRHQRDQSPSCQSMHGGWQFVQNHRCYCCDDDDDSEDCCGVFLWEMVHVVVLVNDDYYGYEYDYYLNWAVLSERMLDVAAISDDEFPRHPHFPDDVVETVLGDYSDRMMMIPPHCCCSW